MKTLLFLGAWLLAAASAASAEAPPARRDPTLAAAPVPPLTYKSPFAGFRALGEDKPIPWRQANDTAAAVGGWRAYAREAQAQAPAASAAQPRPQARP